MNRDLTRRWWPQSGAAARSMARELREQGDEIRLIDLLVTSAASAQWPIFCAALSELADISERGIQIMLRNVGPKTGWSQLYAATDLPINLYPVLIEVLKRAAPTDEPAHHPREASLRRLHILEEVFDLPSIQVLNISSDIQNALLE